MDEKIEQFFEAVKSGDIESIDKLGRICSDVNTTEKDGLLALHFAAITGNENVLKRLIWNGCDTNAADDGGDRAIHLAALNGHENVVKTLILNGCYINAADDFGRRAIHLAAEKGHENVVKTLISNGCDIHVSEEHGWQAIHFAAENGHENVVKTLTLNGCNINAADDDGKRAIHLASKEGHENVVKTLISNGSDIHVRDIHGWQAIHFAAISDMGSIIEALVDEYNVCVNEMTSDEKKLTPLSLAVKRFGLSSIIKLIARNADPNLAEGGGETTLHRAFKLWNYCATNNDKCEYEAKLSGCEAIEKRFRVQSENAGIKCAHAALIQFLIEEGNAKLTLKDDNGKTPLDYIPEKYGKKRHFFMTLEMELMKEKIEESNEENRHLRVKISELQQRYAVVEGMQKERDFLKQRLIEINENLKIMENEKRELEDKFVDMKKEYDEALMRSVKDMKLENVILKEQSNNLKRQLDVMEQEQRDLEDIFKLTKKEYDEASQRARGEIELLTAKIDFLSSNKCCESCRKNEVAIKVFCGRLFCNECGDHHNDCRVCGLIRKLD